MKKFPSSQRGFALVIALSLMAFVLLLILSISTLVQVESQSASSGMQQMRARLNAQLGAIIALGDLQRYTGPDQRVTARADILFTPGTGDVSGQSRWTGVWSSSDITDPSNISSPAEGLAYGLDFADGLHNRQARWLVSGNETNGLTIEPETLLSDDITTNLASLGGSVINKSGIKKDDTVKAPKVEILGNSNVAEGHYAFWVSDDGVKARVNMADPFLDSIDPEEEYYRTAMGQVADPTSVSNMDGVQLLSNTSSRWKDTSQDPSKISSHKNIPMFLEDDLPSGANLNGVSREFFHDFTVHSSGVLANTKDGGLKRDLSTALLSLPSDMSSGGANSPMFSPANQASLPGQMDPGGPKWEQLSDYYNLAKENSILDSDAPINLRVPTNEQVGFTPVITRSNFLVHGFAERNPSSEASIAPNEWCLDTTGNGRGSDPADWTDQGSNWYKAKGYRYSLGMFPLITLWNPYDRDMVFGDLGLEFELPRIDIVSSAGSTNAVASLGQYTSKFNSTDEVRRQTVKFIIRGSTLKAGEALNFSPPSNSYYDNNNPAENVLVARASAPFVNGFFTPPVASSSEEPFFEHGGSIGYWVIANTNTKSRLSLNFTPANGNPSLWRQKVMLYASTDLDNSQFSSENRFKVIDIYASGRFTSGWQQVRVIPVNRLVGLGGGGLYNDHISGGASNPNYRDPFTFTGGSSGTSYFSDFIGPKGDSKAAIHLGSTDLIVGNTLSSNGLGFRNPWGAIGVMRFPNVLSKTWANNQNELDMHLFMYMNPTAAIIPKEPNITWNQANNSMGQLNVYSQGHVMPWKYSERTLYYDELIAAGTYSEQAFTGFSNTQSDGGSERTVLFEVPDNIPLSIGQLAHANLMNFDVFSPGTTLPAIGNVVVGNGSGWNSNTLQSFATPAYSIGNSLASPFLPLDRTEQWFSGVRTPYVNKPAGHYDYSYKLNDALWDEYFFSGITDADPDFPLPNSRLSPSNPSLSNSDLLLENRAAANLQLDGAFNINSTSVAAWEAVLGAMREIETLGHSLDPTLSHNFARFNEPLMGTATTGESVPQLSNQDQLAAGYRNLTDAQIARLASEIVDEIRLRKNSVTGDGSPFLSLSEFINRSPQNTTEAFAWRGALQAAIDKANLNGLELDNTGLWSDSQEYPLYYDSGATPIIDRPKADAMPGSFMQSDLLAKIGAFIQARSDTFTIRSYGSTQEQFGSSEGSRAYYEIVVQRTPSYVDVGDFDYEDPTLPTNQKFGRRYEIKSQRWVSQDEI